MALTRDLVLQIRAVNRASKTLSSIRGQIESIHAATQALNTGKMMDAKGLKNVEQQTKKTTKALNDMDKVVRKEVTNIKNLDGSVTKLTQGFNRSGKEVMSYRKEMTTLTRNIDHTTKKVGMLRGFIDGLTNSTRVSAQGFGKMVANNVTWLAGFALISATIGLVIKLFGDLIDRQNQFAKAGRLIVATTEDIVQRNNSLADSYDAMSAQMARTGRSAEDVAEVQYQLLSAGLSVNEMLGSMAPTLDLIDATSGEVTATTKIMAGIMNNYSQSMFRAADGSVVFADAQTAIDQGMQDNLTTFEKTTRVVDIMSAAFRDHQVELQELRDGIKFSASITKVANIQFDELTAILATLEDRMVKAGRAGRSVRVMISRMVKDPEKVKEAFGVAFDPNQARPMIAFLKEVGDRFRDMPDAAEKLRLAFERFGLRGVDAFVQLALNVDAVEENMRKLDETSDGVGAAMAEVMRNTPEATFKRLWNSIVNLVDALGAGGLVKALTTTADYLARFIEWLANIIRNVQRFFRAIKTLIPGLNEWNSSLIPIIDMVRVLGKIIEWAREKFGWFGKAIDWIIDRHNASKGVMKEWMDEILKEVDAAEAQEKQLREAAEAMSQYGDGVEEALEANERFSTGLETVNQVLSSLKIGDQMLQGIIGSGEAVEKLNEEFQRAKQIAAFEKMESDLNVFTSALVDAESKMETFADFSSKSVQPFLQGMQAATQAVAKLEDELLNTSYATDKLEASIGTLGGKGAQGMLNLANSIGIGDKAAKKHLTTASQLEKKIKEQKKAYDEAFYAGAKREKLIEIDKKITELQEKQTDAYEDARKTMALAVPLMEKQMEATEKALKLSEDHADVQNDLANAQNKTASQRERSAKREEELLKSQLNMVDKLAKQRADFSEMSLKKGEISEEQHKTRLFTIYEETARKREQIDKRILASQETRLKLQEKKEKETAEKLTQAQDILKKYHLIFKDIAKAIAESDIPDFANAMKGAFENAKPAADDLNETIESIQENLDALTSKTHTIRVHKIIETTSESRAMGGLAGYASITNVSAGEGFVPPSIAKHNLPTLHAINQGNAMPARFPIETFRGSPGIDNIQTALPAGSFVISKRGMDALARSAEQAQSISQRRNFQLGGMVGGGTIGDQTEGAEAQRTSRFDLVLNVEGAERRYPLFGPKATIDELADELEKQNLVRL